MKHDAMLMARSTIIDRIDAITAQQGTLTLARVCEEIDTIRHDAHLYGLTPVERMASMLESALAFNGLGPVILSYLDLMREAVACDDATPEASTAFLAALSLRMGR
ncbi:MAG: hypothetical protein ABI395_01800 [Sphingobium sp.]